MGSYQPKYYGGFNGSLSWKKIDFSFDIYGNAGNKVYNAKKGVRTGGNYNVEYDVAINRWQPGSNENQYPRAFNGVLPPLDYFLESGSFVDLYANGVRVSNNNFRFREIGGVGLGPIVVPGSGQTQVLIGGFPNTTTGFAAAPILGFQGLYRGLIDEVRFYDKALTDDEITALYQLELAGR